MTLLNPFKNEPGVRKHKTNIFSVCKHREQILKVNLFKHECSTFT